MDVSEETLFQKAPFFEPESQKPGNHPNFEKNALGVKRPFSEQFSEFRGILGAILGMALTTYFM